MKVFVFDTETTGFINKKELDLDKQPYIIQLAGIMGEITSGEWKEIERVNIFIKPPINIPYGSSQIHHIYDIDVMGKNNFESNIKEFLKFINEPDLIVGHNIEYDESMFKLELKRIGREYDYKPKQTLCTMNETINFCKLPKKIETSPGYKRPKLGELYKKLFGKYFVGAHDAMVDVEATVACFEEIVKRKVVILEKKEDKLISLF